MNVLWIMVDQLRWDYLSCYGADHIDTPNIDWLASQGMQFNRTYVQSPICGPSRMSFYTGRYARSHGATWNGFPLPVGEQTLGDHLRQIGVGCHLVGKTHATPDRAGMARLGIDPASLIGRRVAQAGFDVFVRDDGTNHTDYPGKSSDDYEAYLRSHGMDGANPWEEWANTGVAPDGSLVSGWYLGNAPYPARVPKEHSETAWLTTRGIEFIDGQGSDPWLCHLSYIKPHWPYLVPAPYHDMYSAADLPPPNRAQSERETENHFLKAWQSTRICESFSREDVRDLVVPAYAGLVKELDDQLGRLFAHLRETGRMDDTMIVFSSDHGDNLGDHWLGEKDLFYDCAARVPLIIYDPRPSADSTRGTATDKLVEAIDLVPTFIDFFGGDTVPHILEGRSLAPLIAGTNTEWRDFAVSEYDYSTRDARTALGIDQSDARMTMVFDGRWKYWHVEGYPPLLFDLENDPDELIDLGSDRAYSSEIDRLKGMHFEWARRHHSRVTKSASDVDAMAAEREPPGIFIAYKDEKELVEDGLTLVPKAEREGK
ncbi:MAG: alkaline phosphatase family protein [Pseudomonadota bacterium]